MKAASHVPSGVLISTVVSTTCTGSAAPRPAEALTAVASDNTTRSRRDRSLDDASFFPTSFFAIRFLLYHSVLPIESFRSPSANRSVSSGFRLSAPIWYPFTVGYSRKSGRLDVLLHPVEKRGPVRRHVVPALVLPPGKLAADQRLHRRHGIGQIVTGRSEVFLTQQSVYRAGEDARHETAVRVHPFGIAVLDGSIADEAGARSAQGDQLVRVNRQV